jgi:hypothetical protein
MSQATRRALTSSGRVAPGRRNGSRNARKKITAALSRSGQGPGLAHAKQSPVALDVMWMSSTRCAPVNESSAAAA